MKHTDYPSLYQSASDLSQNAQNAFFRAFLLHMIFLATASAISVVNSPEAEVAILQAMVLMGALGCAVYLYLGRPDRHWYSGRAVAESIKTITWRYISKAEPFNNSDAIDRNNFSLKLKAIVDQNKEVAGLLITHLEGLQISTEMDRQRGLLVADRLNFYKNSRIIDQQNWYAKKAKDNRLMVNIFYIALLLTITIAIFFSIAKIQYPKVQFWPTDFFVTLAAAFLSWIQAKRFQELSASYALAAHEISLIRQQACLAMNDVELSTFVGDAENAFSREHTQWIARNDRK
jgi:SMODS and SLOG-associating 2TM effector domain 3/SMODS and SLOG-associating 2TM effector domain 1